MAILQASDMRSTARDIQRAQEANADQELATKYQTVFDSISNSANLGNFTATVFLMEDQIQEIQALLIKLGYKLTITVAAPAAANTLGPGALSAVVNESVRKKDDPVVNRGLRVVIDWT
jgi:hypothetical protein